ncbi:MAG: pilin [Candidatus Paceibacterota bacterium]
MKNKLIILSGVVLASAPFVAFAQQTGGNPARCVPGAQIQDIQTFMCKIADILNAILPVLIALGVVYFVWGVITYMIGSDEEAKKKGRDRIIYGIIGLAVIIGVWGLVRILTNTFGLQNVQNITFPTVPY